MNVIHGLAARYCIRQDVRGFIELWALFLALAGATIALLLAARRHINDRTYRLAALIYAGVLACLTFLTVAFAATIFRWCYESAAASLGMVESNSPTKGLDAMICLSSHALGMMNGWILTVITVAVTIGLLVLAIFRIKRPMGRALAFSGAAVGLVFAFAVGGMMLFSASWCQSSRLF